MKSLRRNLALPYVRSGALSSGRYLLAAVCLNFTAGQSCVDRRLSGSASSERTAPALTDDGTLRFASGDVRSTPDFYYRTWRRAMTSTETRELLSGLLRHHWVVRSASGACLEGVPFLTYPPQHQSLHQTVRFEFEQVSIDVSVEQEDERGRYAALGFVAVAIPLEVVRRIRGASGPGATSGAYPVCEWKTVVVDRTSELVRLEAVTTQAHEECARFPIPVVYLSREACVAGSDSSRTNRTETNTATNTASP